jgi:hypothetical protein
VVDFDWLKESLILMFSRFFVIEPRTVSIMGVKLLSLESKSEFMRLCVVGC